MVRPQRWVIDWPYLAIMTNVFVMFFSMSEPLILSLIIKWIAFECRSFFEGFSWLPQNSAEF
jgi:hypothetical protein